MSRIEDHDRQFEPITGAIEKRVLLWLAARTPAGVSPDVLTALGLGGALVVLAGYALSRQSPAFLWLASAGFALNWLGDSLDGTLARYRRAERPRYGFFIDHTTDVVSQTLVAVGMGLSPFARMDIALMALVGYLGLSVLVYVRTAVEGVFRISYGKIGPTEVRLLFIAINTAVFFAGAPTVRLLGQTFSAVDLALLGVALALGSVFVGTALRAGRQLAGGESG